MNKIKETLSIYLALSGNFGLMVFGSLKKKTGRKGQHHSLRFPSSFLRQEHKESLTEQERTPGFRGRQGTVTALSDWVSDNGER